MDKKILKNRVKKFLEEMDISEEIASGLSNCCQIGFYSKMEKLSLPTDEMQNGLHYLYDGLLATTAKMGSKSPMDVFYASAGTWVGDENILHQPNIPQNKYFVSDSLLISFPKSDVNIALDASPKFRNYIWGCSTIWTLRKIEFSFALKHGSAPLRVFFGLAHLYESMQSPNCPPHTGVHDAKDHHNIYMDHQRIAQFCQISRPRMTTILGEMEMFGMLKKEYKCIKLLESWRWRLWVEKLRSNPRMPYDMSLKDMYVMWKNNKEENSQMPGNWGYQPHWIAAGVVGI